MKSTVSDSQQIKKSTPQTVKANAESISGSDKIKVESLNAYEENKVMCRAETKEEAIKIADMIGGKLSSYQYGIGVIDTVDSVEMVLARVEKMKGKKPEIYPCYILSANESIN